MAIVLPRPSKPIFTVHTNETFTEPVDVELSQFVDANELLDVDWDDELSYSSSVRDQFAPVALLNERFAR